MSSVPPEPPGEAVPGAARSSAALGQRVAGSAGLLWLLSMGLRLVSTLSMLVLARVLVPEDFGLVALAGAVIVILDVMTNFQAGAAIIKTRDPDKALFDTAFTLNIARGLLAAVVLLALAVPLAGFMETPALGPVLMALAVPLVINSFANPYFILFARDLDFRAETRRRAAAAVAGSLASIALALIFRSYWALIAGNLVQALVSVALSWWRVPGRPGLSLARSRELLGFGGWLVVQQMAQQIGLKFDYFFIVKVLDPATLGAYHVGNQVNMLATGDAVPALSKALFPAFSTINDDPARLRRNYLDVQAIAVAIALPMGIGLAILAEPLVLLLFGPGWEKAVPVVQIMAPLLSLQALGAGVDGMAMALGHTKLLATRQGIYIAARTALIVAGWFNGGFLGVIVGRAVSGIIYPAWNLLLGASLTASRATDPLIASWRSFLAAFVMAAGLVLVPVPPTAGIGWLAAHLALRVVFGGALYLGVMALLWQLSGRPVGAEKRIIEQARGLIARRSSRSAA
ncbi:MAG: oligosaccharide flippase family protein [Polymorphobacter sp.]|uniref:oligosaccharide flippase family protein n=1 Tax=Polymorphobacter sp. TaxID=1909290 RepID=UPI003A83FC00